MDANPKRETEQMRRRREMEALWRSINDEPPLPGDMEFVDRSAWWEAQHERADEALHAANEAQRVSDDLFRRLRAH